MGLKSSRKVDRTRSEPGRHPSKLRPQLPYRIEERHKVEWLSLENPKEGPPWRYARKRGRAGARMLSLIIGEHTKTPPVGRVLKEGFAFDEEDARAHLHAFTRRLLMRAHNQRERRAKRTL